MCRGKLFWQMSVSGSRGLRPCCCIAQAACLRAAAQRLLSGNWAYPTQFHFHFSTTLQASLAAKSHILITKINERKEDIHFCQSYVKTYLVCVSLHRHWQQRCHKLPTHSKEVFSLLPPGINFILFTYKCQWQEGVFLKQSFKGGGGKSFVYCWLSERTYCVNLAWQYHNNYNNSRPSALITHIHSTRSSSWFTPSRECDGWNP